MISDTAGLKALSPAGWLAAARVSAATASTRATERTASPALLSAAAATLEAATAFFSVSARRRSRSSMRCW